MTQPNANVDSMLVLELSPLTTRAMLFDAVAGQYRFLGAGSESSTHGFPYFSAIEGVLRALRRLQDISGRDLLDHDAEVIMPSDQHGRGVDQIAILISGEPDLKMALFGLLDAVSLGSVRRLAASIPGRPVAEFCLTDRRRAEDQLGALLEAKPDLVLMAGGVDNGAEDAVVRLVDQVWMAMQVMPAEERPVVLYTGNNNLAERVEMSLGQLTRVYTASNIHPDIETEDLGPAMEKAAQVTGLIAQQKLPGLRSLVDVCRCAPLPAGYSFGRMIRLLSELPERNSTVLGAQIEASSTLIATARSGRLSLLQDDTGLGAEMLVRQEAALSDTMQWLSADLHPDVVRDYLYNRALFPASLPATDEAMWIELAAARAQLRAAYLRFLEIHPGTGAVFEPVVAGGQWFTGLFNPIQALQVLVDAIQPSGVTSLMLDVHALLPALGAAAERNSLLPVQIVDSNAFLRLGTIIAPSSTARPGTPIIEARLEREEGSEMSQEIRQGSITVLPLAAGQTATLHLKPLRKLEIDPRSPASQSFMVNGGYAGIVIDTRGRPLALPKDETRRRELLRTWDSIFDPMPAV